MDPDSEGERVELEGFDHHYSCHGLERPCEITDSYRCHTDIACGPANGIS